MMWESLDSIVYKKKEGSRYVVHKKYKKNTEWNSLALREINMLKYLKDIKGVVPLEKIDVKQGRDNIEIKLIMPMYKMDLFEFIKKYSLDIRLQHLPKLILSTMETIDEIHKKGIIHRDIKPENIMVDWEGSELNKNTDIKFYIIDFAMANYENFIRTDNVQGTIDYIAPECFSTEKIRLTSAIDIWSLGMTFLQYVIDYDLISTVCKYQGEKSRNYKPSYLKIYYKKLKHLNIGDVELLINSGNVNGVPDELYLDLPDCLKEYEELIISMLEFNPEKRVLVENIIYERKNPNIHKKSLVIRDYRPIVKKFDKYVGRYDFQKFKIYPAMNLLLRLKPQKNKKNIKYMTLAVIYLVDRIIPHSSILFFINKYRKINKKKLYIWIYNIITEVDWFILTPMSQNFNNLEINWEIAKNIMSLGCDSTLPLGFDK